jgi:uncharacterized protein (TIGR00106 family)
MSFLTLVTMTPLGKGESVSKYVAKVVDTIDKSGLSYVVTPMGTIIEGDTWDDVMNVLKEGFEIMKKECPRISVLISVDNREGKSGRIKAKIASLEEKLGKELSKID